MSTTIDERVVEMQFNNKSFERNVSQTMLTLDKLKSMLNFGSEKKSLSELETASKKFNLDGMINAAQTVEVKFSAMSFAAMAAIQNVVNKAMNAGEQIVKSLTIAPVTDGFNEYELKMGSVQTIMSGTGESLDTVMEKLNELNEYSDKTIYSFSDMTSNIGKFTNAGVKLDDAVAAIKGVANVAAVSGANANEASRAMYNFSQALSSGYVKLIDWKSIENANMATVEFKQQLIDTAVALGTVVKVGEKYQTVTTDNNGKVSALFDATSNFNDALSAQWMTTDVLTQTLSVYSNDIRDMTDAEKKAYEAQLTSLGYTKEQIEKIEELGIKAANSAKDVKTFSQMMDTLKEAVGSGWAETWETVFGDFEEGKKLWTQLGGVLENVFNGGAEGRNDLLFQGLSTGWKRFVKEEGIPDARALSEELIKIGNTKNLGIFDTNEYGESTLVTVSDLIKKNGSFAESLKEGWLSSEMLAEGISSLAETYNNLTDEQKKEQNISDETIRKVNELNEAVKSGKIDLDAYAKSMSEMSGRENLVGGLFNILDALFKVDEVTGEAIGLFAILKQSFSEVFPPMTGDILYSIMQRFYEFTQMLVPSKETAEELGKIMKAVFSVLKLFANGIAAVLKGFTPLLDGLLKFTGYLLRVSSVGSEQILALSNSAKVMEFFGEVTERISWGVKTFLDLITNIATVLFGAGDAVGTFGNTVLSNLGIVDRLSKAFSALGQSLNELFSKNDDGADGGFGFFEKFLNGISFVADKIEQALGFLWNAIKKGFGRIRDLFGQLNADNLKDIAEVGAFGGIGIAIFKLASTLKGIGELNILDTAKEKLDSIQESIGGIFDMFRGGKNKLDANGILKIAASIGIFAISMAVLASIDAPNLLNVTLVVAGLMEVLGDVIKRLSTSLNPKQMKAVNKAARAMIGIAAALLITSFALKKIGDMNWEAIAKGVIGLGAIMLEFAAFSKIFKASGLKASTGVALIGIATSMLIFQKACAAFGDMDTGKIAKGIISIGAILVVISGFEKLVDGKKMLGGAISLIFIASSMKIFASAISDFASMKYEEIGRGLAAMAGALIEVVAATRLFPKNMLSIGVGLLAISTALVIMSGALKIFGSMSWEDIGQGLAAMGGALLEVVLALNLAKGTVGGAASILVAAAALSVIAPVLVVLGHLKWEQIAKGLAAIGGSLLIVVAAAWLVSPVALPLLALSGALLAVSAAVVIFAAAAAGFAVALAAITTALSALAAIGPAAMTVVVESLKMLIIGILDFIPDISTSFMKALSVMIDAAAKLIPSIVNHFGTLVTSLLDLLIRLIPKLTETVEKIFDAILELIAKYVPIIANMVLDLITMILIAIRNHLPLIIRVGVDIILALMNGIASAIPRIAEAAVSIIIAFIDSIASQSVRLVNAAFDAMITFINGMADAIENNMAPLIEAVMHLGEAIIVGLVSFVTGQFPAIKDLGEALMNSQFVQGIRDNIGALLDTARQFMSDFGQKIKDKYEEIKGKGKETLQKFIDGIRSIFGDLGTAANDMVDTIKIKIGDKIGEIYDKGKELVNHFVQGLKDAWESAKSFVSDLWDNLTGADEAISDWEYEQEERASNETEDRGSGSRLPSEADYGPSAVPNGITTLTASASKTTATVGAMKSSDLASDVGATFNRSLASGANSSVGTRINNYNYTQINNSPEPINRDVVYRQTKNQMARMKAEVGA